MAVLTLDLGWAMGWCTWRRGEAIASGVVKLHAEHVDHGIRLLAMAQWLTAKRIEILNSGEVLTDVVWEEITFVGRDNGPDAMHVHGKQLGNVERWCAFHKITRRGIPWNTVKKHVTGHGSASQQLVLKTVQQRFPDVVDHNQASAVAVMLTAQNKFPHKAEAA